MARDVLGYLSLHLHAHLPFVRHPEHPDFLEEDWLYEAITETYLPLLRVFDRLADEGVPFRISLTMSPPLVAMLRDELLIGALREAPRAARRARRQGGAPHPARRRPSTGSRSTTSGSSVSFAGSSRTATGATSSAAFRRLEDAGGLELVTCGATHGFLPLMQMYPEAVRAQIAVAVSHHRRHFGRDPAGIWLPECGYYPGVEALLAEQNIRYFFVDTHGVTDATPRPRYGVYAPVYTPSGPAAFGRDPESSMQVWSAETGYPGDPEYREFYRDVGWDLEWDYVKDVHPAERPAQERRHQVLPHHREVAGQGALRPASGPASGPRPTPGTSSTTGSGRSSTWPRAWPACDPWWSRPTTPSSSATGGTRARSSSTSSSARWLATRAPSGSPPRATTSARTPSSRSPPLRCAPGAPADTPASGSTGRTTGSTAISTRRPSA